MRPVTNNGPVAAAATSTPTAKSHAVEVVPAITRAVPATAAQAAEPYGPQVHRSPQSAVTPPNAKAHRAI